jgi:hypothetical protein
VAAASRGRLERLSGEGPRFAGSNGFDGGANAFEVAKRSTLLSPRLAPWSLGPPGGGGGGMGGGGMGPRLALLERLRRFSVCATA